MKRVIVLPDELVWGGDGHLSEVGISAYADGQFDVLGERAISHAAECHPCGELIGHAALQSVETRDLLLATPAKEVARNPVLVGAVRPSRSVTWAMLVAAALASVGFAPMLLRSPRAFADAWVVFSRVFPVFVRALVLTVSRARAEMSPTWLALTFGSTLFMILIALGFTRTAPRMVRP